MASRGVLRTLLLNALGTSSDDPAFTSAILNPLLQSAVDAITFDIHQANPSYAYSTVTLAADSATSHVYSLAAQAPTFQRWLEVRLEAEDGLELAEARAEDLRRSGSDHFTIIGPDATAQLVTSPDTEAGIALWMRYAAWSADMSDDADVPSHIPAKFHDVIWLETLFAFGLGGEQRLPPELFRRWTDRRAQLIAHVSQRGVQQRQTRITVSYE